VLGVTQFQPSDTPPAPIPQHPDTQGSEIPSAYFCLRVDLDYVPWDTPDANEFGHGEPAALLRLLDLVRSTGHRLHFFSSNRVMRAFNANADAVLNEGHDLDWFCKHPESPGERFADALELFAELGTKPLGLCVRGAWPVESAAGFSGLKFLSAAPGPAPAGLRLFPVETKPDRDAARSGMSARVWTDSIKTAMRDAASRNRGMTVAVRPQVLARFDPKLSHVHELLEFAKAISLPVRTLRQL
jgi:hypothetical protein